MVWWSKKPEFRSGWEEDEEEDKKSDSRFTPQKETEDSTLGTFERHDGSTYPVEEVKTSTGVHYRQVPEFLDDEEHL